MSRPKRKAPIMSIARGHDCDLWRDDWAPGWFCPCEHHGCRCGHWAHDAEGCAAPDPRTGWCECDYKAMISDGRQLIHNGSKPR